MKKRLLIPVLLILSCTIINAQNSLLQKAKNKVLKEGQDNGEGITSPLHEKYLGRIVFAKEVVTRELPGSKYDSVFTLGEPIYVRAYLKRGIGDYKVKDVVNGIEYDNLVESSSGFVSQSYTMAYVDGVLLLPKPYDVSPMKQNDAGKFLTTFQFAFFASENDEIGNEKDFVDALNKLSDGTHTVRLETFAGDNPRYGRSSSKPIAVGEFTLVKKGSVSIGKNFEKLKAGKIDPVLETSMLKALQNHAKSEGWKESFSKVKIASEDWDIERNKYTGVILGRSIVAWGYAVWPDGHCSYQQYSYHQNYDGSAFVSTTTFNGVVMDSYDDCDCSK